MYVETRFYKGKPYRFTKYIWKTKYSLNLSKVKDYNNLTNYVELMGT